MRIKLSQEVLQNMDRSHLAWTSIEPAIKSVFGKNLAFKSEVYQQLNAGQKVLFMFYVYHNHTKSAAEFYWFAWYLIHELKAWQALKTGTQLVHDNEMLSVYEDIERMIEAKNRSHEGIWREALASDLELDQELSQAAAELYSVYQRAATIYIDRLNNYVNDHLEDFVEMEDLFVIARNDYPTLSGTIDWDIVTAQFSYKKVENESLISNISIIPVVGEQYVVMQLDSGKWELAGGTLEPDEPYMDALKREVKEELGAELVSYTTIGHFQCHSSADRPFRSHIPHPHFIRLVGYGEVNIVGVPLNPPDGETVIAVDVVPIEEAVRRFEAIDRYDIAELYRLAHHLRSIKG